MACLPVYCLALDGWLAWWIKWRTAKPDPEAPRCPRYGYSLKGSQGLGCPECGLGRDDKASAASDVGARRDAMR